jgi:predicted amidohydrolase
MRVSVIQHDIVWENPDATCAQVAPMIAKAAGDSARLIVLTEMFATGFSMRPQQIAEDEGGPIEQFLLDRAREHDAYLIASIAQRSAAGRFRNNAVVAAPDGSVRRYAKIHPFTYSGEHEHYEAGSEFLTVDIDGLRTSVFVCYDLRFADEFWGRAAATDAYVVVANWPDTRRAHWRKLLQARAIENQAYVVGVNRVGTAKRLDYVGDSLIVDPLGEILADGGAAEGVFSAEVDPGTVARVRRELPFLPDRRTAAPQ